MNSDSLPENLVMMGGFSGGDKDLAKEFAQSALSLVDWSVLPVKEKAALALAALASASEDSVEKLVAHYNVTLLKHRNPDGSTALVIRNPWCIIERGVHIDTALQLLKWKELRAGARIGRFTSFGDWATVGEMAVVGDNVKFEEHTVVPDKFDVSSPHPRRAGFLAKVNNALYGPKDLETILTDDQKRRFRNVRVQNALDLVDLVSESLTDDMDDRTVIDVTFDITNAYFFENSAFDTGDDRERFSVFERHLVRHFNPDGTTAVVTRSGFGGLGDEVTVDGHAFVGNWAEIGGASEIAKGCQTPSHITANDISIGWEVDRKVATNDLQDLMRRPFLIASAKIDFLNGIPAEEADIPSELSVKNPQEQPDWSGLRHKVKQPPFAVSAKPLTTVDGAPFEPGKWSSSRRRGFEP
ncbi:hypothetical protein [Rhizobium sp. BK176]|uniref:hypothetical protein n=1 Tax=Rhizobium sp. BK176 TaxID=2587071 RepID=UPI002167FD80|nr:hypothetical protein [Rhizobium sp. BK176]MCS4088922.1 hypothetical protein [Rhizobium sp. BK176]